MAKLTLPTLYKYDSRGLIQEWTIWVEGNKFWTVEGVKGGKLTTSEPTICFGKNIGRANETTDWEQAIKEAQSKFQKKLDKGYNEKLTKTKKFFEPMLAQKYEKYSDLCFVNPTFIQPKLDGCVSGDTLVATDKGDIPIQDIYNSSENFNIKTYNQKSKKIEFKPLLNRMRNGIDINESNVDWYEIELNSAKTIRVTGNHLVFLPKLNCWRRVDQLENGDSLLNEF